MTATRFSYYLRNPRKPGAEPLRTAEHADPETAALLLLEHVSERVRPEVAELLDLSASTAQALVLPGGRFITRETAL